MGTLKFEFNTLKGCFEFLVELYGARAMQSTVAGELDAHIYKYYNLGHFSTISYSILTNFLRNVSELYNRLWRNPSRSKVAITGKNMSVIIDGLLKCIPRFFAALYYLLYRFDSKYVLVGGGGWSDLYAGYYTYGHDELNTYLFAKADNKKYGVIPGGFTYGELQYWDRKDGYTKGKHLVKHIYKILSNNRASHSHFRNVVFLTLSTKLEAVDTGTAFGLVDVFCQVVKNNAKEQVKKVLEDHFRSLNSERCLNWKELQRVCSHIKSTYDGMIRDGFKITGQQFIQSINSEIFIRRYISWYVDNFGDLLLSVQNMHKWMTANDSYNPQQFTEKFLFPYGFIFDDNKLSDAKTALDKQKWVDTLGELVHVDNGLVALKKLLEGDECSVHNPPQVKVPEAPKTAVPQIQVPIAPIESPEPPTAKIPANTVTLRPVATRTEAMKSVAERPEDDKTAPANASKGAASTRNSSQESKSKNKSPSHLEGSTWSAPEINKSSSEHSDPVAPNYDNDKIQTNRNAVPSTSLSSKNTNISLPLSPPPSSPELSVTTKAESPGNSLPSVIPVCKRTAAAPHIAVILTETASNSAYGGSGAPSNPGQQGAQVEHGTVSTHQSDRLRDQSSVVNPDGDRCISTTCTTQTHDKNTGVGEWRDAGSQAISLYPLHTAPSKSQPSRNPSPSSSDLVSTVGPDYGAVKQSPTPSSGSGNHTASGRDDEKPGNANGNSNYNLSTQQDLAPTVGFASFAERGVKVPVSALSSGHNSEATGGQESTPVDLNPPLVVTQGVALEKYSDNPASSSQLPSVSIVSDTDPDYQVSSSHRGQISQKPSDAKTTNVDTFKAGLEPSLSQSADTGGNRPQAGGGNAGATDGNSAGDFSTGKPLLISSATNRNTSFPSSGTQLSKPQYKANSHGTTSQVDLGHGVTPGDMSSVARSRSVDLISQGSHVNGFHSAGDKNMEVHTPSSNTAPKAHATQFSRILHTPVNLDSVGGDTEEYEDTGLNDGDSGGGDSGTFLQSAEAKDVLGSRDGEHTGSSMSKDTVARNPGGPRQGSQDNIRSGSPTGGVHSQAVFSQHLNPQSSSTIFSGRGPDTVSPAPIAFAPPTAPTSKHGPASPAPLSPVSEPNEKIDKNPVTLGGVNDEDPKTEVGSFSMPSTGEPPGINGGGSSVGTGQGGTNTITPRTSDADTSPSNTSVTSGSDASQQVRFQVPKQTPAAMTFTKITDDQIWELQKQSMHGENYNKLQQKIKQRSDAKQRSQIIPNLKKHVYHTDSYASDARSGGFTRFSPQYYIPQKGQQKPAVRNDVIINGDVIEDPFYENDRKQRERVAAEAKRKEDVRQMKQTTDESTWMAAKLKFADEVKEHKLNVTKILQDIKQKDLDLMQSPPDFNCIVVSDTSKVSSDDLYGKVVHTLDGKAMTYDNDIQDPEEKRMEDLYNTIMEDYLTEDNTKNVMEKMKEEHRKEIEKFNREAEEDYNVAVEQNRIVDALANSTSLDDASSIPLMENMTPSMSFLAEFDGSPTADARGSSPMLPLPQIDFDIEMAYKPDRSDDNDGFRNHPPPAAAYKINAPLSYNYPDISSSSPYLEKFDEESLKSPTVDFCVPLWTSQTPNDNLEETPEIELFPAEAPRTVRDMLRWLVGIGSRKHLTVLEKCINEAFGKVAGGVPGNPTLCVNNTKLKSEDIIKALKLASIFSSSVLSAIEPDWKQKSSRSGTVKGTDTDHDQDPDGCALLCQLQDYVYACYHQLAFLRSQCAGDKFRGGWMGCQFGWDVTADSPLQAFLTDAYYSKFKTHLFDPCDVCLKSRIRMGFRKGDFSKSAKDSSYLYYLLSPSCSGDDDPLMTLSSYLNCLSRRTPRITGELVSFFQHFGSEMRKDGIGILSDMGKALSTPHPNCPEWDHLGRHDLDAVRGIRVSESPVSKHDNDHAGTLSTLVGCDMTNVQCTKLLSPITHRAYAIYSPCFAYTYLSWVVYLADTLRESLDRLRYDLKRHNVSKCGSIHHCHDALPYLYFHGFTPPEGTSTSPVKCSDIITKLKEVVNGGPIARLINCMDDFLYRVRWPFIYTVIALWSTAFLLFAHTALYRLDVLRIQSHLMRSRESHVIDVKALLTDGMKMPSLYDIDYFDDEALAHAWNRIY